MLEFDNVWTAIVRHEGQEFRQLRGQVFKNSIKGNVLFPSTTNRALPRSQFEQAFNRRPLNGPGQINDLQGPSYLFAILTDSRICG